MQKASAWIDIEAPCQEVFETIADVRRRMQLSPLWGLSELLEVGQGFPGAGSTYRIRVLKDAPFGVAGGMQNAVQGAFAGLAQVIAWKAEHSASALDSFPGGAEKTGSSEEQAPERPPVVPTEQIYFVTEYQPPSRLTYHLDADCKTIIRWQLQEIPSGTRVNYEEVFCDEHVGGTEFLSAVHRTVSEWLSNLKRYSELRGSRGRRLARWFLDRFFLRLRPDQRRTVMLILVLQGVGLLVSLLALISLGIASLLF